MTGLETGRILNRLQAKLVERFGARIRTSKARRTPEWTLVQGLIGSRMPSEISSAVADRLLGDHGNWDKVLALPQEDLASALKGVRFPNQGAKRLRDVLGTIAERRGSVDLAFLEKCQTGEAIAWLEGLPGVGRKIAAQVVNTSTLARPSLVLDTHHLRILARMGLIQQQDDTAKAYDFIMPSLPPEWDAATMDEHHMLMKELGRTHCRPKTPLCPDCPALLLCETGQARTNAITATGE